MKLTKKQIKEKRRKEFELYCEGVRSKRLYPSKMESMLPVISEDDFFNLDPEETRELFTKNQKKSLGVGVIDNSEDPDFWTTL